MSTQHQEDSQAQLLLPSSDLPADIEFLTGLGFRLDNISPADNPSVANMSGHGLHVVLDKTVECPPATIYLLTDAPADQETATAPNGTVFKIKPKSYHLNTPPTQHKFEVRHLRDSEPWIIGRAGMLYRDLIPDRLGGSIIASHIRIPNGGPVPDMVHYHTIGFQLIFCYSGWVKLVYEDQGPPFILKAGDCVTQPPEIRHRVLESSDNLEVIEIGVPAEHMTTIDHDMELPTEHFRPERKFQGQRFCHHVLADAEWSPWKVDGLEYRETGISEATKGVASVQVVRPTGQSRRPQPLSHNADIFFAFIMQGEMEMQAEGHGLQHLKKGDAFVMPPQLKHQFEPFSSDLEMLVVALPGDFRTDVHSD